MEPPPGPWLLAFGRRHPTMGAVLHLGVVIGPAALFLGLIGVGIAGGLVIDAAPGWNKLAGLPLVGVCYLGITRLFARP